MTIETASFPQFTWGLELLEPVHDDTAPLLAQTPTTEPEHQEARHNNTDMYDLEFIEIPQEEAVEGGNETNVYVEPTRPRRKRAKRDDFVYFHPLKRWQEPSPWPPLSEIATSASFDPFGLDSDGVKANDLPIPDTKDFFMPNPMVDPSGVTVDSFYLNLENTGIEFYPNRAVKMYYQNSSLPADGIPESFLCPIGLEIMADPVILPDGHSYDRTTLIKWLKVNNTSPATRQVVSLEDIRPNWMLRNLIRQYKQKLQAKERRQRFRQKLERRGQRRAPIPFEDDGVSRLAI